VESIEKNLTSDILTSMGKELPFRENESSRIGTPDRAVSWWSFVSRPKSCFHFFRPGALQSPGNWIFEKCDGLVCYSSGILPVFLHPAEDVATFRFYTSRYLATRDAP
jgi:hypothetical protein